MIPKVIHYCWFGMNEKPPLVKKCMESWKRYCPEYSIVEWNESNFDVAGNDYVKEAYESGKWAFVADYARLWIIYHYGGIYLDTDVEILKSFDSLLEETAFLGLEDSRLIATGLGFGAEKRNGIVKTMLQEYDGIHFINEDGSFDTLTCPIRNTNSIQYLLPKTMDYDKVTKIKDATIFPREYFCPLSADGSEMLKTKNTYSIHWFTATWLSPEEKIVHDYRVFRKRCENKLGKKYGRLFARAVYLFRPGKRKILKKL